MPLLHLLARLPCSSKTDCHGSPHCIRGALVLRALLRFTMMALIASMVIDDGFNCAHCNWWCHCRLLLLVATVPSSDACVVFTARIVNSSITIQTELLLYQVIDQPFWSGCAVCCQLVQPIIANKTFSHAIFADDRRAHGLIKVQAKVLTALSKLRIKHLRVCSSPHHSMVNFLLMLVTDKSLIWSL